MIDGRARATGFVRKTCGRWVARAAAVLLAAAPLAVAAQEGAREGKALVFTGDLLLASLPDYRARVLELVRTARDIEFPQDDDGNTPMHYAAPVNAEILEAIIARGGRCDARNAHGATPLHFAAAQQALQSGARAIHILSECGAAVDAQDDHGMTPLHAVYEGVKRTGFWSVFLLPVERHLINPNRERQPNPHAMHGTLGVTRRTHHEFPRRDHHHLGALRAVAEHGAGLPLRAFLQRRGGDEAQGSAVRRLDPPPCADRARHPDLPVGVESADLFVLLARAATRLHRMHGAHRALGRPDAEVRGFIPLAADPTVVLAPQGAPPDPEAVQLAVDVRTFPSRAIGN